MKSKIRYKFHIISILLLFIIFFGLLFCSLSKSGINKSINFKNNIIINKDYGGNKIIIGNLIIENSGLLPKRINLDNFIACRYYNNGKVANYGLHYELLEKQNNEYYGIYHNIIDISSKQKLNLNLLFENYIEKNFDNDDNLDNISNNSYKLYIFKFNKKSQYYWYNCDSLSKKDAIKIITIN